MGSRVRRTLPLAAAGTTIETLELPDDESRLRHSLAMTVVAALAAASSAAAQQAVPLLSVDAQLGDFGLDDLDSVVHGRVSLVHDPAGDRIALQFLKSTPATVVAASEPTTMLTPPSVAEVQAGLKALWVWTTSELLQDMSERRAFLDFIESQAIERVFLYLPAAEGEQPSAGYIPFDGAALAPLLAEIHARGALTYALDGDPDYVHVENHVGVLRTVQRVAEYNRSHRPEERFLGVRYDVEPYLVRGFQGPQRQEILAGYVSLLAQISEVAHPAGLAVGADIPFWFDAGDENTGEPFEAVLNGVRAPVLHHVMASVDDIAIMAYRTSVDGPNGVLLHSAGEIAHGRISGVGVFVGVETTHLLDEDLYTLRGVGRVGLPDLGDATWIVLEDRGGDLVRVWFASGEEALAELEHQVQDPGSLRTWFAGQPVPLPGDMLSFHALGPEAMNALVQRVVLQFGEDPAFLGLAYHDYRGLSALLQR